jgi:hypothetical protein
MTSNTDGQLVPDPQGILAWITRYRASGLSLKAFAQQHGLSRAQLHYWVYQKSRVKAPPTTTVTVPRPVFQEIKLGSVLATETGWAAEVSLPTGLAVRFSATAHPHWVGAVVQTLQRPC